MHVLMLILPRNKQQATLLHRMARKKKNSAMQKTALAALSTPLVVQVCLLEIFRSIMLKTQVHKKFKVLWRLTLTREVCQKLNRSRSLREPSGGNYYLKPLALT